MFNKCKLDTHPLLHLHKCMNFRHLCILGSLQYYSFKVTFDKKRFKKNKNIAVILQIFLILNSYEVLLFVHYFSELCLICLARKD